MHCENSWSIIVQVQGGDRVRVRMVLLPANPEKIAARLIPRYVVREPVSGCVLPGRLPLNPGLGYAEDGRLCPIISAGEKAGIAPYGQGRAGYRLAGRNRAQVKEQQRILIIAIAMIHGKDVV